MNVVFIGRDFYWKSGTEMSSVYEIIGKEYKRTDWGFIQAACARREEIHIRPANEAEEMYFKNKLANLRKSR